LTAFLSLQGVSKHFGGVYALRGVDFDVRAGEVHALVGENGAGKSTMMKIIAGNHQPDAGQLRQDGAPVRFRSPREALAQGVALIHQETALVPELSVAENVLLSQLPGILRRRAMQARAAELIRSLGFDIDPAARVATLSAAQRQVVEIAKALSLNVRLLVLDEPTAALAPSDAARLLAIVRGLRNRGVAVVYISHRLDEVFQIADRITVLKDGAVVDTLPPSALTMDSLIRLMVGRPLAALFPRREGVVIGPVILQVENLGRRGAVDGASLQVRSGEVVGLGGLIGSGRSELLRLIFGADRRDTGKVLVDGVDVTPRNPAAAVRAKIGLVPEDRKHQGAVLSMPIRINATMARLPDVSTWYGALRLAHEKRTVASLIAQLRIKARDMQVDVSTLSGGNQQKVVLAKWFHAEGKVILLDEPTRGVDVGAKVEIYQLINTLAAKGMAVLVVSSDHNELIGLCDRILVMGAGRIRGELAPDRFSEENIVSMSLGMAVKAPQADAFTENHHA
jgi:ribose transport system ATP-binding protein